MKRIPIRSAARALALLGALGAGGTATAEVVALRGATVHPISGPSIPNGTLVLDGARIVAVGADAAVPPGARVIELQGLHIYPSLFDANSVLGLTEIGSVRGTVDISETSDCNPNARAEVAINADSELLPVARAGGVLVAMSCPRGGLIAGTACVFRLDGWNWEDMVVRAPVGLLVNWPSMRIDTDPAASTSVEDQKKTRDEKLRALRDAFAGARSYVQAQGAAGNNGVPSHPRDPRWEALVPVLEGKIPVLVAAPDILQQRAAIRWAEEEKLKIVLLAGDDVWRLADDLARLRIPVVLGPTWDLPQRRWEPYDTPLAIASKLHAAGVTFCIAGNGGGFTAQNTRNLPIEAATAVAYGLPRDVALRAITLAPAEIFGVADRLGSLSVGREATFIVTSGDPLDIRTSVVRAWVRGRETSLETRHTRLWQKYRDRPRPEAQTAGGAGSAARGASNRD